MVTNFEEVFEQMQDKVFETSTAHGFEKWPDANTYEEKMFAAVKCALIATEAGEALEAVRNNYPRSEKIPAYTLLEEELADVGHSLYGPSCRTRSKPKRSHTGEGRVQQKQTTHARRKSILMIEGIKLTFKGTALVELKLGGADKAQNLLNSQRDLMHPGAIEEAEASIATLRFFAEHINPEETYLLEREDGQNLWEINNQ